MKARLAILVVLLTALPQLLGATLLYSYSDGHWESVDWSSEMLPETGDTLVVRTTVTINYALPPVTIIVAGTGIVRLTEGEALLKGLNNHGRVMISRSASLRVDGSVQNDGSIDGEGLLTLVGANSSISGAGIFGNLLIAPVTGGRFFGGSDLQMQSLSLGLGAQVDMGSYNLRVDGPYSAASLDPRTGITAGSGLVVLNGTVFGAVLARVIIGNTLDYRPSLRRGYPTVSGTLGGNGLYVHFTVSRRLSLVSLAGNVLIDSGVVVEGAGIGEGGSNSITGSLLNNGVLRGEDPTHRWILDADIVNNGSIENCTVSLRGYRSTLETSRGKWDPDISLEYIGPQNGILEARGSLVVSHCTIGPLTGLDSNVVIHSTGGALTIRHDFQSDLVRNCRLEADSTVHIRGQSNGFVRGDVLFEGFWGRERSGRYGDVGKRVRIAVPSRIVGTFRCDGGFISDRSTDIEIAGILDCRDTSRFQGALAILPTGRLQISTAAHFERDVRGGGDVVCAASLNITIDTGILDSVTIVVGTLQLPATVAITGNSRLPRLHLFPGSTVQTAPGVALEVSDRFVHDINQPIGYNLVSVAARPIVPTASSFFPGATSLLYRFDNAYIATDTVKVGEGYFVRFDTPTVLTHIGRYISLPLDIPLKAGWNIIGAASLPVNVSNVTVSGTQLESGFLPSSGASTPVSILQPGVGYWVRASSAGTLRLNTSQ